MKVPLPPVFRHSLLVGLLFGCTNLIVLGESDEPVDSVHPVLIATEVDPMATLQDPVVQGQNDVELRKKKTVLLVKGHLTTAHAAFADGRLLEAENSLLAALELDSSNHNVRALFDQVQVALGRASVPLTGSIDDVRLNLEARIQRAQAEIRAHAERGFKLMEQGELVQAVGALSLAKAGIEGTGYNIDWQGLDNDVAAALEQAKSERDTAMATQRESEKRLTWERLRAEEEFRSAEREQRLSRMLTAAIASFDTLDFDESYRICEDLLREDPLNKRAREISDATFRARHKLVNEKFVAERNERFQRWQEDIAEAMIPTNEILSMPDLDYWAKITAARAHFREIGGDPEAAEENLDIIAEIASTKIPGFQVEAEPSLEEVINRLRPYTDVPIVVTPDAVEAVDSEGIEFDFNLNRPITVENALRVITDAAGDEVVYTFKHGVVYVTTRSSAQGQFMLRAHDVQDLTATLTDFSGPKIDRIHLPDEDYDDEESIQGGVTGDPIPILDPMNLETLVMANIAKDSWDELDGVSLTYSNGHLIVWHTAAVQRQIDEFLQDMRRYISSMVTIEARFLTVRKDFLKEIGIDFRGLGGTFSPPTNMANLDDLTSGLEDNSSLGLDNDGSGLPGGAEANPSAGAFYDEGGDGDIRARTENILGPYGSRLTNTGGMAMQFVFLDDTQLSMILRAVEKSDRAEELNSSTISCQNTQRAFITVVNQVTYVQDMDVEVAQAALIADPQVGVVSDGIVLDVRPTISHDRRYITLELRPTVAHLKRPIPEFTSSLAGLTTPVTLQLPELVVSSANTTAVIPDGGSVIIAGLKKIVDVEQRAEVPFLAKIPFLSVLFKSEGEASEKEDIIIIIRAQITDALEVANELDKRI